MSVPDAPIRIRVLDLTVAQVEALEVDLGLPVTRWREAPSAARVLVAILGSVEGKPREAYASMTFGQLLDRVDLSGQDADPEG